MSVNADLLPTNFELTPDLHRKIFFCTFADVTEYPDLCTPSPKGSRHEVKLNLLNNMAKSKNGGSRAYLRGRIGSDVYSIGKTSKGAKQQVVRSLAESVANPRTSSQMFGRMIMSTVMQAVSALKPIIDHSFDEFPTGQPSISEFIRRNYTLIKDDATAHPSSDNKFGLNRYQQKGIMLGCYQISAGSAVLPAAVDASVEGFKIELTAQTLTVGGLKTALGFSEVGYLTCVLLDDTYGAEFVRLNINSALADSTAITSSNIGSVFVTSGNAKFNIALDGNNIAITPAQVGTNFAYGVIASDKVNGAWVHSPCTLAGVNNAVSNAHTALPTYPVGSEQFLNGGNL